MRYRRCSAEAIAMSIADQELLSAFDGHEAESVRAALDAGADRHLRRKNIQGTGGESQAANRSFHVKIESGTQVASRGPTWRNATPLV
jgi:hypothetical protein